MYILMLINKNIQKLMYTKATNIQELRVNARTETVLLPRVSLQLEMERREQSRLQEKARYQKELEEARRRELQQKQIIAQLSQQKQEIAMQQLKLRQKMAADEQWLQTRQQQVS